MTIFGAVILENFLFDCKAGERKFVQNPVVLSAKPYVQTMNKTGYVYILASDTVGTLYIGVTSNIIKRIHEHRQGCQGSFTARYKVHRLVYFQEFATMPDAISYEKKLKFWRREWKIRLIEETNPKWDDLYPSLLK